MTVQLGIFDSKLFEEYLRDKKGLMESSIHTYIGVINQLIVETNDLEDLEGYNSFLVKYSIKKRCAYYYNVIRSFIDWKITDEGKKEYLLQNLVKPSHRTDPKYERKYLTEEKILDVINNLKDTKHKIIALIQTLTGVRAGDVIRLKIGSIVPEEYEDKPVLRINVVGKGNKRNVVYIHDEVAQHIVMNYLATVKEPINNFLFITMASGRGGKGRKGTISDDYKMYKMNYVWYYADLKQALQSNRVKREDFATHDFRRCFARRAWERWHDVNILQGLLNHARPDTTLLYLQSSGLKNIDYLKEMQNG
jgi:integrase